MLPRRAQDLLESERLFELADLLELVDTDHKPAVQLYCQALGQLEYLVGAFAISFEVEGYAEFVGRIGAQGYLRGYVCEVLPQGL